MTARNWCFTLNNYTSEDITKLDQLDCRYIIYGKEVAPDTGTPHLQGYIQGKRSQRLSWLKKNIHPTAHFEIARGKPDQNIAYCSKEGDFTERGQPTTQGKRKDLDTFVEDCKASDSRLKRRDLIETHATVYAKFPRFVQEVQSEYHPPSSRDTLDNHWFTGDSGTGKSSTARKENPDAYIKAPNKWWDNYNGEHTVIIEDLDPDHAYMAYNLKIWGDHYPFPAEIKGGKIEIRPQRLIITSQYRPEDIFPRSQDVEAITRRFPIRTFAHE
jgi:hypothetical protein